MRAGAVRHDVIPVNTAMVSNTGGDGDTAAHNNTNASMPCSIAVRRGNFRVSNNGASNGANRTLGSIPATNVNESTHAPQPEEAKARLTATAVAALATEAASCDTGSAYRAIS